MTKRNRERRVAPRVDINSPVCLEGISDPTSLVNISLGGVLVACDSDIKKRFHVGKLVKLSIKSPTENQSMDLRVRVLGFSSRGMHCAFEYLDKKARDAIDKYLDLS